MIFNSLVLKNFKSYGDYEQTVELNHVGIKLISAVNGAGKSSLIEAIIWCLFGKSLQDAVEDVVNYYTKKNCKVSVNFDVQGINYTVYRYRAHETHGNALYIFQGDKNISMKNLADTQNVLQEIISIPFTAMTNSIIFSSELYSSFLRSSRGDRLKVFESVLSLKEIGVYYENVKKSLALLEEQLFIHNDKVSKVTVGIMTIKQTIMEYKEKAKASLTSFKVEKETIEFNIKKLNDEIIEIDKIDVSNELSNIEKLEHNKSILEKIESEKKKLIDINSIEIKSIKLLEQIEKLKQIDVIKETLNIDDFERNKKAFDEINNEIELNKKSIVNLSSLEKQLQEAKLNYINTEKNLNSITEAICPVCHQELQDLTKKELENKYDVELKMYFSSSLNLNKEIKKAELENKDYEDKIQALEIAKKNINLLQPIYTREMLAKLNDDLNEIKNSYSILSTQMEEGTKFNDNAKSLIVSLNKELFDITVSKYSKDYLTSLIDRKTIIDKTIQDYNNRVSIIDETAKSVYDKSFVELNDKKIKVLESLLNDEGKEINNINEEKKYFDILFTLFSNKESGFKKYFIGKMIGFFNESINFYIPFFFTKPVTVNFDKDLNETITIDGMEVNFKSFSAGMKTRVEIAIAFGLFQLSKTFFSSDTNLLVFDEILDQNLDSDGFNAVIEVINGMADNSIFIISHQDAIKDSFDNIIKIEADENGFSKIA